MACLSHPNSRAIARARGCAVALAAVCVSTELQGQDGTPQSTEASPPRSSLLLESPRELSFRLDLSLAKSSTRPFDPESNSVSVDLLLPLREASLDKLGPFRSYVQGPWGAWYRETARLSWGGSVADSELAESSSWLAFSSLPSEQQTFGESLVTIGRSQLLRDSTWSLQHSTQGNPIFDTTGLGVTSDGLSGIFRLPPAVAVPDWRCRRPPVLITRSAGEGERFNLVQCDGAIAPLALDRLSILARPEGTERPFDELPDEPLAEAWSERREWAGGVRLVHPRLLWVLQELADAFPRRSIIIYSGVRPFAQVNDGSGHKSLHASGRALDIAIHRVSREDLFKVCVSLRGVGCGFYPEGPFIHVDVRHADPGTAFWVDGSAMGQPARYLSDYPGLVEGGKLSFPLRKRPKR